MKLTKLNEIKIKNLNNFHSLAIKKIVCDDWF